MTLLNSSSLPESQANFVAEDFYLDGTDVNNTLVYTHPIKFPTIFRGADLKVLNARISGTLQIDFYKNNTLIPGSSVLIDGANPAFVYTAHAGVDLDDGDEITGKATTTFFAPLKNVCTVRVLFL